jgi:hypothetical protein
VGSERVWGVVRDLIGIGRFRVVSFWPRGVDIRWAMKSQAVLRITR